MNKYQLTPYPSTKSSLQCKIITAAGGGELAFPFDLLPVATILEPGSVCPTGPGSTSRGCLDER